MPRYYIPYLNRFTQPDSIVPLASQGTQAWDRYAYANNNPVRYNDPTGHMIDDGCDTAGCDGSSNAAVTIIEMFIKIGADPQKKQYRQHAIDMILNHYNIRTANFINGKPLYTTSLVVRGESVRGHTLPDQTVLIGPDAFDGSVGRLAATIAHEGLHALQFEAGRAYTDFDGSGLNEVEARDFVLKTASDYGLTKDESDSIQQDRDQYLLAISPQYRERANRGIYTLSGDTISEWLYWLGVP